MADEGFRIEGIVELTADESSINALAADADRALDPRRDQGRRDRRRSPAAPGGGAARDALSGAGGAALAKQIGDEFAKVQDKTIRKGGLVVPVTAGAIAGSLAKRRGDGAISKSLVVPVTAGAIAGSLAKRRGDGAISKSTGVLATRSARGGAMRGTSAAASVGVRAAVLAAVSNPVFLAVAAVIAGTVAVAVAPKILASIANKRLGKLTGLPGAEFSPELSALALRRQIRERQRTISTGRIRGRSAAALATTTDEALDRLANIGAAVGVAVDRILKFLIDAFSPFLRTVEDVLRFLGLLPGTSPLAANLPVNLLFGTLQANAQNQRPPASVIPLR